MRATTSPSELTNVRYRELDPRRKKNGRCEYLVTAHGAIGHTVRYLDYELGRSGAREDRVGLMRELVRAMLFDPVLPIEPADVDPRRLPTESLTERGALAEREQPILDRRPATSPGAQERLALDPVPIACCSR